MIWELIKRNPAWQVMPVVALMVVASVLFAPSRSGGDSFLAIPFILFLGVPGVRQRSTLLQATLPIAGKQLFLSRIASLMACTWLPILAAVTVTVALRSDRTWADHLPLFEAGAMITAVLLLFQCVRVRTIDPPGWLAVVPYVGIVILFPLLLLISAVSPGSVAIPIAVLSGCAFVSTALFLKAWTDVPKSFQLAPVEPASARSHKARRTWPTVTWWPVFLSLYGWRGGISLFAAFGMMLLGMGGFTLILVPSFFVPCRLGLRWLMHLPIPARKLFWAVWFPITAAMIAGFASSIPFDRRLKLPAVLPKIRLIALTAVLVFWMLQICVVQLQGWKRLRNVPLSVRMILSGAGLGAYAAYALLIFTSPGRGLGSRNPLFDALVRNLASILPDNLWMIALIAVPPIAGLYWLAEKLFREMEFGQIEVQAQGTITRQV